MTLDKDSCWQELEGLSQQHKGMHYITEFPVGDAFRMSLMIRLKEYRGD